MGALRSNRGIVVVTVLTCKTSLTSPLIHDMAAFRGKVTSSIVGASADDRAQLTCRDGLVLVIIVFNVGDAPCAPIGL
jgi:hypothetical protein